MCEQEKRKRKRKEKEDNRKTVEEKTTDGPRHTQVRDAKGEKGRKRRQGHSHAYTSTHM